MTYKYSFYDDYSEGAHPHLIAALTRTNLSQELGYGKDSFCQEAVRLLREKVGNPDADIHFVLTGTQANLVELFTEDLYFDLARRANAVAGKLSEGIKAQGYPCWIASTTNQLFPIFPQAVIEQLQAHYGFHVWAKVDATHSAVRLVTSWATTESAVEEFLADLRKL